MPQCAAPIIGSIRAIHVDVNVFSIQNRIYKASKYQTNATVSGLRDFIQKVFVCAALFFFSLDCCVHENKRRDEKLGFCCVIDDEFSLFVCFFLLLLTFLSGVDVLCVCVSFVERISFTKVLCAECKKRVKKKNG